MVGLVYIISRLLIYDVIALVAHRSLPVYPA
jgi:hypothetical protein